MKIKFAHLKISCHNPWTSSSVITTQIISKLRHSRSGILLLTNFNLHKLLQASQDLATRTFYLECCLESCLPPLTPTAMSAASRPTSLSVPPAK